jgi:hypothetical protein
MILMAGTPREAEKFFRVVAIDGWEHREEFGHKVAVVQIVEERLGWDSRALEYQGAAHQFWIGMNWAVIERQHGGSVAVMAATVNERPGMGDDRCWQL